MKKAIIIIIFILMYNLCKSQELNSSECYKYSDSINATLKISRNKKFAIIEINNLSVQNYYYSLEEFELTFSGKDKYKKLKIDSRRSPHDNLITLGTIQSKCKIKQRIKIPQGNFNQFLLNFLFLPASKLNDLGYKLENWDKKISDLIFLSIACEIEKKAGG